MGGQGKRGTGTYRDWLQPATSQLLFNEELASDAHTMKLSLPPSPAAPHPWPLLSLFLQQHLPIPGR